MTAEEDAALMAEIARLTGQINQYKSKPQPPSATSGMGGWRGRDGSSHRYSSATPSLSSATPSLQPVHTSRHRSLVFNNAGPRNVTTVSGPSAPSGAGPSQASNQSAVGSSDRRQGWVRRKTTHNMSLVSSEAFEKTEPARLAAQQEKSAKKPAATPVHRGKPRASSASVRRGDNMGEVIIDGVVFAFDETGTKLVKKISNGSVRDTNSAVTTSAKDASSIESSKAPLRTSVNGQSFIRTKRGNLISAELLEKRKTQKENNTKMKRLAKMGRQIGDHERLRSASQKTQQRMFSTASRSEKGLCTFFTKTGQCKRGLSCPFRHDPSKLAICLGALRPTGCSQPPGLCPLSHDVRPERAPHCVHYLGSGSRSCRNGDDCPYTHPSLMAHVHGDSPICMDFATYGWCDRGRDCASRHTFDCPDFIEKGSCERKGCRLQHIIRPGGPGASVTSARTSGGSAQAPSIIADHGEDDVEGSADFGETQELISSGKRAKRKRPLGGSIVEDTEVSGGLSFALASRKKKKKRQQAHKGGVEDDESSGEFTQQRDYIGFSENEAEDSDEESSDEEVTEASDAESVSSGEDEDDSDSGSDGSSSSDNDDNDDDGD